MGPGQAFPGGSEVELKGFEQSCGYYAAYLVRRTRPPLYKETHIARTNFVCLYM
jgi:hypothetical protein